MGLSLARWKYTPHHFAHKVEGHLFLGHATKGACTITLTPAASMTQPQLNRHARKIVAAVNRRLKPS